MRFFDYAQNDVLYLRYVISTAVEKSHHFINLLRPVRLHFVSLRVTLIFLIELG